MVLLLADFTGDVYSVFFSMIVSYFLGRWLYLTLFISFENKVKVEKNFTRKLVYLGGF